MSRRPRKRHVWTWVEVELLKRNYHNSHTADLAVAIGQPVDRVLAKANALGLKKDREFIAQLARERTMRPDHGSRRHQFPKGHVPANKGLRRPGWAPGEMARTQFKKGNRPHTWVPVGSYRINGDGHLEIKLNDEPGPYHVRWMPVHQLVWAQADLPVPEGHVLVFKPGRHSTDPTLITVDALELTTRAELMRRNSIHHLPEPLKEVLRASASLTRAINHRTKKAA